MNLYTSELCWKSQPLISPSETLSNKWLNWCHKCSVPIHEKITCFSSWNPRFHTNCKHVHSCPDSCRINQFTLQPMSSNPEPSYVPHDTFAQSHLQLLRQDKWCTCIRNRSLRQSKPIVISHRLFLTRARILTMCLSPNCLMPESQVYVQIRNI